MAERDTRHGLGAGLASRTDLAADDAAASPAQGPVTTAAPTAAAPEASTATEAPDAAGRAVLTIVVEVAQEVSRRASLRPPTLSSSLDRDLGLDSLARIELIARLEQRFRIRLAEEAAFAAETPAELLQAVLGAGAAPGQEGGSERTVALELPAPGRPAAGATTLVDMLRWHVNASPERVHIRLYDDAGDGELITYGELWTEASQVAAGLQARGLAPGEAVVLMLPTGRAYFQAFYGILLAGGIPVPIYPPARRAQLEDHLRRQSAILRNAGAAMLVTVPEATMVARLLTSQVETLREVSTVTELAVDSRLDMASPGPEDIGFLQYTSGSTGDPKGVILSHANLLANVRADGAGIAVTPEDVFVSWLPLYHDMGLIGAWLGSLYHGIPLVLMSPLAFLSRPQRWLQAIHRHGGTLSAAPNFAYELCNRRLRERDLEGLDLSRWRLTLNGAEAISPTTMRQFCSRLAPYGFRPEAMLPVYGLAECAVGLAFSPLGREPLTERIEREALAQRGEARPAADADAQALEFVACGQPLPDHELRVVDAAGRELPERRQGRLQFRGPSATRGYYRAEEHTRALIQDGWLDSGDLAYIAAGDLYITGRSKDLIIKAGRNIYPVELEGAVGELPGVRSGRVAVFGSPDPQTGTERLVVVAETRLQKDADRAALTEGIHALATDLVGEPADDVVLAPPGTVLKTSSGKIRRVASRELYEGGRIGARAASPWLQIARLAVAGIAPQLRRAVSAASAHGYGAYAWSAFTLFALAAFVFAQLPLSLRSRWYGLHRMARLLARLVGIDLSVTGGDALAPAGRCIYVSNHQSYLDGFVLMAALPTPVAFLVKAELRESAPVRRMLSRIGAHFVRRFDAAEALADLNAAIEATGSSAERPPLLVFAEGTFKRMPGLLPFHMGAFMAAVETGAAVVPVTISGTRSVLRGGTWLPRRGPVRVTVSAPVTTAGAAQHWRAALALRDAVRAEILRHGGEPDLAHESNQVGGRADPKSGPAARTRGRASV